MITDKLKTNNKHGKYIALSSNDNAYQAFQNPLLVQVSWKAPEAGFSSDSTVRLDSVKPPPHRLSLTNDYLTGNLLRH